MINLKNILKVLFVALFVCAYSGNVWAETSTPRQGCQQGCKPGEIQNAQCHCAPAPTSTQNFVNSCTTSSNGETFGELICTGKLIFYRLRDLIYVVAGFGIIAVAVGGFFGNLNWKWLGAIVISLVVIASAGELLALLTGGTESGVITDSLTRPTLQAQAGHETFQYNKSFISTEEPDVDKRIKWDANVERESAVNYNTIADTDLGAGDDISSIGEASDDDGNG